MPNLPSWTGSFKQAGIGRGIAHAGEEIGDVLREKRERDAEIADKKRNEQITTMKYWAPKMTPDQFNKQIAAMSPENRPPDDVIDLIRPIVGAELYADQVKKDLNTVTQNELNNVLSNQDIPKEEKIKFARSFAIDQKVPTDRIDEILVSYGLMEPKSKAGGTGGDTPHDTQVRFLEKTISTLDAMEKDFMMSQLMDESDKKRLVKLREAYAGLSQSPGKAFNPADWNKLLKDVKIIQDKIGKSGEKENKWDQYKVQ